MPWYQVVIKHSEDEMMQRESAKGLMEPFQQKHKEAGYPQDVDVWLCLDDGHDRIYYFSPKASEVAITGDIFRGFNFVVCTEEPDLEGCRKIYS